MVMHRQRLLSYQSKNALVPPTASPLLTESCAFLENIISAVMQDYYDLQQEGIVCLELAALEPHSIDLLLWSPHFNDIVSQLHRILGAPAGKVETLISTIRILRAICQQSPVMINMLSEIGLLELLENIQVRALR